MNLTRLLTLARDDGETETRAKWRNAHRARFIRGKYQEGAMLDLGVLIHRSRETLYKWAGAAELYTLLLRAVFDEVPARDRQFAFEILRKATRELSPWFFATLYPYWRQHESLWVTLQDLDSAVESGWSIGDLKAHLETEYNPAALTREQQAVRHILKGVELLQTTEGDSLEDEAARLRGFVLEKIVRLNGSDKRADRQLWAMVRAVSQL